VPASGDIRVIELSLGFGIRSHDWGGWVAPGVSVAPVAACRGAVPAPATGPVRRAGREAEADRCSNAGELAPFSRRLRLGAEQSGARCGLHHECSLCPGWAGS